MKRTVVLFLCAALLLSLCACGERAEKRVDLEALREEMLAALSLTEALPLPVETVAELYGIEDAVQSGCFMAGGGVFPDEVIMVETKDAKAAAEAQRKLENKLAAFLSQAKDYDPAAYATAQECRVVVRGNYAALFLSASHAELEAMFEASFG